MSRPVTFRQTDLKRALETVRAAGVHMAKVRFPPEGGFELLLGDGAPEQPAASPLEAWRAKRGGRAA